MIPSPVLSGTEELLSLGTEKLLCTHTPGTSVTPKLSVI